MTKNKKIIISIIVGLVIVAIITTGTIVTLNVVNNDKNDKAKVVPTKATADELRVQAEKARADADKAKSKELLLEAQQQYETLPKTDENTNAKVDIEAQLYLLEHAGTPETTPTPAPAP